MSDSRCYWDTSALLKLYVKESESTDCLRLLATATEAPRTSEFARVELYSALRRRELSGDLVSGGARALLRQFANDAGKGRFILVPSGRDVSAKSLELIDMACSLDPPIMARSLDVLHLASALLVGCDTLVSTDKRQRELAKWADLKLLP